MDKALSICFGSYEGLLKEETPQIISAITGICLLFIGSPYFESLVNKDTFDMIKQSLAKGFLVYFRIKENKQR